MTQKTSLSKALQVVLADTYALYLKTQTYHWNVTGSHFHSYHLMLEDQYKELAEAIDDLAERLRALGEVVPASFGWFESLSEIDTKILPTKARDMMADLIHAHEILLKNLGVLFEESAKEGDPVSEDMATDRMSSHEKTLWMLRSTAE